MRTIKRAALAGVLALAALAAAAVPASAAGQKAVYTSSNGATGNQVIAFDRAGDGSLSPAGSFATGGNGTGSGLGSQGALGLSRSGRFLYVVNAGRDSISTFEVRGGGPQLKDTTPSGGDQPISLTVRRGLLYALNAGSGTISGFSVSHGDLTPLAGSTRPISGSGPAEVEFSNGGDVLVVTNKAT